MIGLKFRNAVSEYQRRYPDMPRPVVDLGPGRSMLWTRAAMEKWARDGEGQVNDFDVERLKDYLMDLGQRLSELDVRIARDDEDSRRSLLEAVRAYNGFASILDPDLVVPDDLNDTDEVDESADDVEEDDGSP